MSGSVKVNKKGLKRVKRQVAKVRQKRVKVGYLGGTHSTANMPYAQLAAILEYGAALDNGAVIPPRPALRQFGFRWDYVYKQQFLNDIRFDFESVLTGKSTADSLMKISGERLKTNYQEIMRTWISGGSQNRHNAGLTIQLKGFDKPFVETGELIANAKYEVV